ncbi:MAG: hypothetical protein HY903_07320 [Deltaproteobacteria bacterium]|nr:hypothetical protein [Deltaproteobacteria bacterium]
MRALRRLVPVVLVAGAGCIYAPPTLSVPKQWPVATVVPAGPVQVRFGSSVTLDGSSSSDPDGTIVSFAWTLPPGLTAAALQVAATDLSGPILSLVAPSPVPPDPNLPFTLTVVDNDGLQASVDVLVVVLPNAPPVATIDPAGPVTIGHGKLLQLNGSGSFDPDGDLVAHAWTLPIGTTPATFGLVDADLQNRGLVLRLPATTDVTYAFTLEVRDNDDAVADGAVAVSVVNRAPVLRLFGKEAATPTLTVSRGGLVPSLDFSASGDPDGDPLTFSFTGQIAPPDSVSGGCPDLAFFFDDFGRVAHFTIPDPTSTLCGAPPYTVKVVAADDLGLTSAPMIVSVLVENAPPRVTLYTSPNDAVTLPGGTVTVAVASAADPDGDSPLTYTWTVESAIDAGLDCRAAWAVAEIGDPPLALTVTAPLPAATPECAGDVNVTLTVTDAGGASGSDGVRVRVGPLPPPATTLAASNYVLAQGATTWAWVPLSPPQASLSDFSWFVETATGSCTASALTIPVSSASTGGLSLELAAATDTVGCVFRVRVTAWLTNGKIDTAFLVTVTNDVPAVRFADMPAVAPGVYAGWFTTGDLPSLTAEVFDSDPRPPELSYTWTGDLALTACAPPCTGVVAPGGPAAAIALPLSVSPQDDTATFTVTVADGAATTSATLNLERRTCLYVGTSVTNAASPEGTLANPYLDLQQAIDQAAAVPHANVCILEGVYAGDIVVRASAPLLPGIEGGFDMTSGAPLADRQGATVIETSAPTGVSFEPGATNVVSHLTIRQKPSLFAPGRAAAVSIVDASPILFEVTVTGGAGNPASAILVVAATEPAAPMIQGSTLVGSDRPYAVDVETVAIRDHGPGALATIDDSSVCLGAGLEHGTGVVLRDAARAHLTGVTLTDACLLPSDFVGFSDSEIAVDLQGSAAAQPGLVVNGLTVYFSALSTPQDIYGVRLREAFDVEISGASIYLPLAARAGIAIADGTFAADGSLLAGSSRQLNIHDNAVLKGGAGMPRSGTCGGSRYALGVLLAGTSDSQVVRNPDPADFGQGIGGGVAAVYTDPALDPMPPSVAGIWLVDTTDVSVADNSIWSGDFVGNPNCGLPSALPVEVGFADGLPATPHGAASLGSMGLLVNANRIDAGHQILFGAMDRIDTPAVGADLQAPASVIFVNNLVSTGAAVANAAVRQTGGTAVTLANNLLIPGYWAFDAPPAPFSVAKYGLWVDAIGAGSLSAFNNIILVPQDDAFDDPRRRLTLREDVSSGTASAMQDFDHNLLFIAGSDPANSSAPVYARIGSPTGTVLIPATGVNAIGGIAGNNAANLVADPLLVQDCIALNGSTCRLAAPSPAIDNGRTSMAPVTDADHEPRAAPIDIGPDEWL